MFVHSPKRKLPENSLLLVLESLWRTESLTASSAELATSTATVSRGLSAAREYFNDQLFVRCGPKMLPTELMRRLAPQIIEILEKTQALAEPEVFDPAKLTRTVRIVAADNAVLAFLLPAINKINRLSPGITFEILAIHGDLFDDLRNRRVDLAFFPFSPVPEDCKSLALTCAADVLMVRKDHPLVGLYNEKKNLTLEDLQKYPKVRISNVVHKFPVSVVKHHDCLMAQEEVGATVTLPYFLAAPWFILESDAVTKIMEQSGRMIAKYLPVRLLPLPGISTPYDRRIIWHEKASGDVALQWIVAMLASAAKESISATENTR